MPFCQEKTGVTCPHCDALWAYSLQDKKLNHITEAACFFPLNCAL